MPQVVAADISFCLSGSVFGEAAKFRGTSLVQVCLFLVVLIGVNDDLEIFSTVAFWLELFNPNFMVLVWCI